MGTNISLFTLLILSNFLLLSSCFPRHGLPNATDHQEVLAEKREALEIIIGGGGGPGPSPKYQGCPPPPPTPCPPPPSPPPLRQTKPPSSPPIQTRPKPPTQRRPPRRAPQAPNPRFPSERIRIAYYAIQKFKNFITIDPLHKTKTWRGYNVCHYEGFTCEVVPDKNQLAVSGVVFNGYNFSGENLFIDKFINQLPDITLFHANSNGFKGTFPSINTQKLRYFYELDLSNNKLTGEFPSQVFAATNLTFLDLRFNSFCGSVPPQLFYLDVNVIFINDNKFSQNLPANLGSTPASYITFARNGLTGSIPSSIGQAKKTLVEIVFSGNQLSGCLPYEIGFLSKATLFDASDNKYLTGPIPYSFACMDSLQLLNLAGNQFYGPVPEMVCKLPRLGNFTLRNNYFTQVGPECMKLIWKKVLDVSNNCILDLPNQRSKADCARFFSEPKHCTNQKLLTYIPCHKYSRPLNSHQTFIPSPKRTYAAFIP